MICPGDAMEVRAALRAALVQEDPVYIRIGKKGEPVVHKEAPHFAIGRGIVMREGQDICLLSTGNTLPLAMEAAALLDREGLSARVVSMHTVKPLDTELMSDVFGRCKLVASVEEHSVLGGLGSALAEWLTEQRGSLARLLRFGTRDEFMHEAGEQEYARQLFGIQPAQIAQRILGVMKQP